MEITISVLHPEGEEVKVMQDGEWVKCRREKIILARGTMIRSWFVQIDNKHAIYLNCVNPYSKKGFTSQYPTSKEIRHQANAIQVKTE